MSEPYIGINNVAKTAIANYIGVENIARKATKMYIGIGDIAKLCYTLIKTIDPKPELSNTLTLTNKTSSMAVASRKNYAMFAGGSSSDNGTYDTVDVFDKYLTKTNPEPLIKGKMHACGASINDYFLVMGGWNRVLTEAVSGTFSNTYYGTAEVYDPSFTKVNTALQITNTGKSFYGQTAANVGNSIVVAGGESPDGQLNTVYAIDSSLTVTGLETISSTVNSQAATSLNNKFAIFSGGCGLTVNTVVSTVDAYDESLTKHKLTDMTSRRTAHAAASVGNTALIAGGVYYSGSEISTQVLLSSVDAYDESLTKITSPTALSNAKMNLTGASAENYAMFAGGYYYNYSTSKANYYNTVDLYDESLTKSTITAPNDGSIDMQFAQAGNYLLFAGGANSSGARRDAIDVYKLK